MKKITILITCLFASLILANPALADKGGNGKGQGQGNQGIGNVDKGKPAKFEKFDKSGINGVSNVPPGLQDKGLPPGLSKQNKVPAGWNKDRDDRGDWDDENVFRRSWHRFVDWFN